MLNMIYSVFGFIVAGFLGAACHWYKKYYREEISDGFVQYLMVNQKHTVASSITILMSTIVTYSTAPPEHSVQALLLALYGGYMADSMLNKGSDEITAPPNSGKKKAVAATSPLAKEVYNVADDHRTLKEVLADDQSY